MVGKMDNPKTVIACDPSKREILSLPASHLKREFKWPCSYHMPMPEKLVKTKCCFFGEPEGYFTSLAGGVGHQDWLSHREQWVMQ